MIAEAAQQTETAPRRDWRAELRHTIAAIPHKTTFGLLFLAWFLLFQFAGNSTQGYVKTPSLFGWLSYMYDMGTENEFCYLVPFVVLGFLWWKRTELAAAQTKFWWPAVTILVAALLIHAFGFFIQQSQLAVVGFYFGIWGLIGMVWGPDVMRRTFFPFLLLVFCVPLGTATDSFTFRLRWVATTITVKICHLFSIGVQQSGTNILDPQQRYQYDVAAACSGIRSLTAVCAIAIGYAFVFFTRYWKRTLIIALAIPLAVFSNVLRLLTIVFASEIASTMGRSPQAAGQYAHDSTIMSLLPYIVAFVGLLLAARWLKEDREVDVRDVVIPVGAASAVCMVLNWFAQRNVDSSNAANANEAIHANYAHGGPGLVTIVAPLLAVIAVMLFTSRKPFALLPRRGFAVGLAGLLMIGGFGALLVQRQLWQRLTPPGVKVVPESIYAVTETNQVLAGTNSIYLPQRVLSYRSLPLPLQRIAWDWLPKDTTFGQRRYIDTIDTNFFIDNMVVLMGADRTSIHKPQYCITGQGFSISPETTDHIRMTRPISYDLPVSKIKLRRAIVEDGRQREIGGVFVYWFVSDTEVTAEHNKRMTQMVSELIRTGVLQRWAYVACMAYCEVGQEDATYERMKEFIRASVPEYQLTSGKPLPELSHVRAAK